MSALRKKQKTEESSIEKEVDDKSSRLRTRHIKNYKNNDFSNANKSDFQYEEFSDSDYDNRKQSKLKNKKKALIGKRPIQDIYDNQDSNNEEEQDYKMDKLPNTKKELQKLLKNVDEKIEEYRQKFFDEWKQMQKNQSSVQPNSIPICADVQTFDFKNLAKKQLEHGGQLFDVIMMDPPWQLSTSQPSRGVAIAYDSLTDDRIQNMPIKDLQENGFIFIWAINAKYRLAARLMENWGYKLVDEITWIKKTVNGKIAKGHGFYLQHAKESCLIGVKGNVDTERFKKNICSDVIFSERRGQSQKPNEIYESVEQLCPNGFYLEIFARRNNLRNNWVSIGNEL